MVRAIGMLFPLFSSLAASQQRAPVIDMHLHAIPANSNGPPPLGLCIPISEFPVRDARDEWENIWIAWQKKPPCRDPVWSPVSDSALRRQTIAVLERRNVIGVLSGPPHLVDEWRAAAPERTIAGLQFQIGRDHMPPDSLRALHRAGKLAVLAEVTNQYVGITPDDRAFAPYLALAESLDVPVGIHVGTGPPGTPYFGLRAYRGAMHSALTLENVLITHPRLRLYIMHAGWPMLDDLLAVLWAHPHVYVELGALAFALPRAEFYRFLQRIVDAGFSRRVMFGSDQMVWPGVIEPSIDAIEHAPFLTRTQRRDILYNNAARFLRLSDAEIARHHGRPRP